MKCPKCKYVMQTVAHHGIEIDRCTNCHGIWFDMLEAEHLARMKGSECLEATTKRSDNDYNIIKDYKCPKCHTGMGKFTDPLSGIALESCGVCNGVFFDAGEFKEYREARENSLFARLRRLLAGK